MYTFLYTGHTVQILFSLTHIFVVIKSVEDVVGEAGQQVDHEPRLEVVHADNLRKKDLVLL